MWLIFIMPKLLGRAVFPPECAIAGILRCNQKWPPEKWREGQFVLSFYKTTGLNRRSILKAIPGLKIVTDTVTNVTKISSLVTKIRQKFWFSHHNGDYISLCWWSIQLFCHTLCPSRQSYWKILASKTFNIRKEVNPSFCSAVLIISHRKTSKFEITL